MSLMSLVLPLPKAVFLQMSEFCDDRTLVNLRRQNRHLNLEIAQKNGFSKEFQEIKKLREELGNINKVHTYFNHISSSCFRKVISRINNPNSCVLFRIGRILKCIFPCISREIELQNKMRASLDLTLARFNPKEIQTKEEVVARLEQHYRLFTDLFGNIQNFNCLPILMDARADLMSENLYVKPTEMTHPIMRGVDNFGRTFFAIRVQQAGSPEMRCQTFYERYSPSQEPPSHWPTRGGIYSFDDSLILSSGVPENKDQYLWLKTLIRTGEMTCTKSKAHPGEKVNIVYRLA